MLQIRDAQLQHICVGQTYISVILCMQVDVTLHVACCDKSADPLGLTISDQIWPSSVQVEAVTMVVVVAVVVHIVEVGTQRQLIFHVSFLTVLNT
jgi:hypothetical protein